MELQVYTGKNKEFSKKIRGSWSRFFVICLGDLFQRLAADWLIDENGSFRKYRQRGFEEVFVVWKKSHNFIVDPFEAYIYIKRIYITHLNLLFTLSIWNIFVEKVNLLDPFQLKSAFSPSE